MARRSNSTTANGNVESFDNAPISSGGPSGLESDAVDNGGLPIVNTAGLGNAADGDDGNSSNAGYGIRADGTPAKKRGRKPGQANGTGKTKTRVEVSVSGLEKTLVAIHTGIAALLKNPVWMLDEKEATALSEATANVARHYNATIDPKWADIFVLVGLMGTMYAPRVIATFSKKKQIQSAPTQSEPMQSATFANLPPIPGVPMTH